MNVELTPSITSQINKLSDNQSFELVSDHDASGFYSKGGGRVSVSVQAENWTDKILLYYNLRVNTTLPVLKPKAANLTINSLYEGMSAETEAVITQANVQGLHIVDAALDPVKAGDVESGKLAVRYENGKFVAELKDSSIKNGSYVYSFVPKCVGYNADMSSYTVDLAPVRLTVRVINTQPTAKLSMTNVTLNNVFIAQKATVELKPTDTSHGIYDFNAVSKARAGTPAWDESQNISITEADGVITAEIIDSSVKPGTYQYSIEAKLGSASVNAAMKPLTLSVRVANTQPRVTLSATSLSLNTALAGPETASFKLNTTAGYKAVGYDISLMDTNAATKAQAEKIWILEDEAVQAAGNLDISTVYACLREGDIPKAGTYRFAVSPKVMDEATGEIATLKAINFTVRVYANARYSATVSASGKLDAVARDTDAITYTLTRLTNVVGQAVDVELVGDDAEKFNYSAVEYNTKGQPVVRVWLKDGESYATNLTYKIILRFTLDSGIKVDTNVLNLRVSSTALRLVGTPKQVNVYQSQSRMRIVYYNVNVTAPVGADISEIRLGKLNAQQQAFVDVATPYFSYNADGSATVKLVIRDTGKLAANKTHTLPLEVFAYGQATATPAKLNLSVKVLK